MSHPNPSSPWAHPVTDSSLAYRNQVGNLVERSQEHTLASRSPVRSLAGYRIQVVHPTLHTQVASTVSRVGSQVSTAVSRVGTVVSRVVSTQVGSLVSRRLVRKVATPEASRAITLAVSRHLVSRHLVSRAAEARGASRGPVHSTEQSTVVHGRLKGLHLRKPVMAQHLSNLDTEVRLSRRATGVLLSTRASRTQDRVASPGMVQRRSSPVWFRATAVRLRKCVAGRWLRWSQPRCAYAGNCGQEG